MLFANVSQKVEGYNFSLENSDQIFIVSTATGAIKTRDEYLNNLFLPPYNALKKAVEVSLEKEIASMVFRDGIAYFSTFGKSVVELIRNGQTVILINGEVDQKTASGFMKLGDQIVMRNSIGKILIKFENKNYFLNKDIYLKPVRYDEVNPESKRMTLLIGVVLLALLLVSIGLGVSKKRSDNLKSKYEGILVGASKNLDEAISLAASDPEKSRELFKNSENGLKEIEKLEIKDGKVTELKNKISQSRESILGEYEGNSELFLDLGLLSSGFTGNKLAVTDGQVFILDISGKKIISVEVGTKKSKVVAGPSVLEDVFDLASYEDTIYTIGSDGIYEVSDKKNKVIEKTWQGEVFIKVFGGNMYILDKSGNQILRYQGNTQGFSEKQNWLSSSVIADFSNAQMFGIDGSVYVLYPNSKILKYSQGSPQSFRLSGVIPEIGNIDSLYADPNNTYLYLLDKAGKRVVVTDKKGNYKAQYIDEKIGNAVSLAVSETDKKIILLTGEKLMQIEIRHL